MHIEKYLEVISACRFCFMCRHLDPVANVTFREADTPRGRALICDRIRMDKANLANADFIDALYRSALSAANRCHCVSHYDETGLVLAARQDIVEAGLSPEKIKALAKELAKAAFAVKGKKGATLYYGPHPELYAGCATIAGRDPGKALEVLGFAKESKKVLAAFKKAVAASGCKTLVVAEPSAFDFLKDKLPGVKVVHCAEYLLTTQAHAGRTRTAVYLESDFLKNYDGSPKAPRELLKKAGYALQPFGTNTEESYAVGEGAVVYDDLNPELCEKLCNRVYGLAGDFKKTLFITASLYVRDALKKYNPTFNVVTLEEAVAS
jgi:Fe-S oxidoreductase